MTEDLLGLFLWMFSTNEGFRNKCLLADIRERDFKFVTSPIFRTFQKFRDEGLPLNGSIQRTIQKWDLRFNFDSAYTTEQDALVDEFKHYVGDQKYKILAKSIEKNPKQAKQLIEDFSAGESKSREVLTLSEVFARAEVEHEAALKAGRVIVKIPRWELLSDMIGGFNPSRLSILMAASGFGKTLFGLNLAYSASTKMGVLYLNLEMNFRDIAARMAADILNKKMRDLLFQNPFAELKGRSEDRKMKITDGSEMSFATISALARLESTNGLGLMIVDYDQKITLTTNREQPEWKALQDTIKRLEELAKELDCHVMVLSQVNRQGEISGSHRATFSAATVLELTQDEDTTVYIRATKNRFGKRNAAISVIYEPENQQIREQAKYEWSDLRKL